jgi:hypothetical protein
MGVLVGAGGRPRAYRPYISYITYRITADMRYARGRGCSCSPFRAKRAPAGAGDIFLGRYLGPRVGRAVRLLRRSCSSSCRGGGEELAEAGSPLPAADGLRFGFYSGSGWLSIATTPVRGGGGKQAPSGPSAKRTKRQLRKRQTKNQGQWPATPGVEVIGLRGLPRRRQELATW